MKALECDSNYQSVLGAIKRLSKTGHRISSPSLSELKGGISGKVLTENQIRDIKRRQYEEAKARREEQQMLRVSGIAPKRRKTKRIS